MDESFSKPTPENLVTNLTATRRSKKGDHYLEQPRQASAPLFKFARRLLLG